MPNSKKDLKPAQVRVGRSCAGLGLFAAEPLRRGQFVIEYTGRILNKKQADARSTGRYLFETSPNRFIEGSERANIARYLNHSCRPNCEAINERGHIRIYAIRKIKPGEELTYDYGREYFEDFLRSVGCVCGDC
ncbi:MAG: SET domain-containing protein [Candidatus Liptonbacteria bacterium]|nr:SET domain-containing protein [Candidatus Liptonbacteria bacterium]